MRLFLFGLLFFRLYADPFIVITPPKCGTNLVSRALYLMTDLGTYHCRDYDLYRIDQFFEVLDAQVKEKRFIQTHIPVKKELIEGLAVRNYKVVMLVRDPRDQLISALCWINSGQDEDHIFAVPEAFHYMSYEMQVDELITGDLFGYKLFDRSYRSFFPWLTVDSSRVLVLRFEDLVGPKGGGTIEKQREALYKLARHIGFPLTEEKAAFIGDYLFGKSLTFRSGQIGEWKKVFTPEQKKRFEETYAADMAFLGYQP